MIFETKEELLRNIKQAPANLWANTEIAEDAARLLSPEEFKDLARTSLETYLKRTKDGLLPIPDDSYKDENGRAHYRESVRPRAYQLAKKVFSKQELKERVAKVLDYHFAVTPHALSAGGSVRESARNLAKEFGYQVPEKEITQEDLSSEYNVSETLKARLKRQSPSKRAKLLHGIYKQLVTSEKGRTCDGEYAVLSGSVPHERFKGLVRLVADQMSRYEHLQSQSMKLRETYFI